MRPMDMIDQIGGLGARYGEEYELEQQRMWLTDCTIQTYWLKLLMRVILKGRCYLLFYNRLR